MSNFLKTTGLMVVLTFLFVCLGAPVKVGRVYVNPSIGFGTPL